MQDERDDQEQEQDEDQEDAKQDPFDGLSDIGDDAAFRAWELQLHAIETVGELYFNLAKLEFGEVEEVKRAAGNALIDLLIDHNPRKLAVMASTVAINQSVEPKS